MFVVAVSGFSLIVAGCDSGSSLGMASVQEQRAATVVPNAPPRLQAGDKIRVTVFGEAGLSGEYEIDPGGFVSLPLAGTLKAAGATKSELEQTLAKKFRGEYLKSPKVTVDIATFRPVYVLGEVEKPGEYPYKSGLNVVSAIAVAGGNTYRSSQKNVLIQHPGESGFREYPLSPAIQVQPGDVIKLPERYF
jgi:protein involved in polysaccharide export with SLBB domain